MEKCKRYGCLAGSGPQTQWLASTRRQWVTLLILDRRQVGAGGWSGGEAEVIVQNSGWDWMLRSEKEKLHSVFVPFFFFFATVTRRVMLQQKAKRKRNNGSIPVDQHKMAAPCYTVQSLNKRVGGEGTHMRTSPSLSLDLWFPASVVRSRWSVSSEFTIHPNHPFHVFNAFALLHVKQMTVFLHPH